MELKKRVAPVARGAGSAFKNFVVSAAGLLAFSGAFAALPPDPPPPKVQEEKAPSTDLLWIGDKVELWKSDLSSGLCGENHAKVLFEINKEKMRLMESALKSKDVDKNLDNLVDLLINFEDSVRASMYEKRKIPECASR